MELNELLQQSGILVLTLMLVGGIALNYFGLRLHYIALFLVGAIFGAVLGSGGALLSSHDGIPAVLITLFAGLVCGLLTVFLTRFIVFIVGGVIGALLMASTGHTDPLWLGLGGFTCGALTVALYDLGIILITSFSGSLLMFHGLINLHSVATKGHIAFVPGTSLKYGERLIEAAFHNGLQGLGRTLQNDGWLLGLLFLSGALVQFGMNARAKSKANQGGKAKAAQTGGQGAEPLSDDKYPEGALPDSRAD